MTAKTKRCVQDFSSLKPNDKSHFLAAHDGIVHFPLGAASYVYEKEFFKPKLRELGLIPPSARFRASALAPSAVSSIPNLSTTGSNATLTIHIGAQPNNSPHTGTIVTFALAFLVARGLQHEYGELSASALVSLSNPEDRSSWVSNLQVRVQLDLVDTAPDQSKTHDINGIVYQRSHRATGAMHAFLADYHALLAEVSTFVQGEVKYTTTYQSEQMRDPLMRHALRAIILDREQLEAELAPQRERLPMRAACPVQGCGMADKHGIRNEYAVTDDTTTITFHCPTHGPHMARLEDAADRARIELNTPLRNLACTLVAMADTHASRCPGSRPPARLHMRVTGADYAGPYQEQLLLRQLARLCPRMGSEGFALDAAFPVHVYAPLIVDWSGAKLSKSLYVRDDAYAYLRAPPPRPGHTADTGWNSDWEASRKREKGPVSRTAGMDWLLEFRRMREEGKDRTVLYRMVERWVACPTMLFNRVYSLEYVRLIFEAAERELGVGNPKNRNSVKRRRDGRGRRDA